MNDPANFYAGFVVKEKHELEDGCLYWLLLTDNTLAACVPKDGTLYWIGDEKGIPLSQIGGSFVGPIPEPPVYVMTVTPHAQNA